MLFVSGSVRNLDGPRACGREQSVKFQRLVSDRWLTKCRTLTGKEDERADGFMMWVGKGQHPPGSKWRVLAPESTLPNGDVCLEAVSKVIVHPHAEDQR